MKCKFCQQECTVSVQAVSIVVEACDRHPHRVTFYHYIDDPEGTDYTTNWEFKVYYENKYWVFTYGVYDSGKKYLQVRPEGMSRTVLNSRAIHFDSFNGITPENALQKLPLIITFS